MSLYCSSISFCMQFAVIHHCYSIYLFSLLREIWSYSSKLHVFYLPQTSGGLQTCHNTNICAQLSLSASRLNSDDVSDGKSITMIKWRLHYPECTCTSVKPSEEFIVICVDFRKGKKNVFHNPPSHAYTHTHLVDNVKTPLHMKQNIWGFEHLCAGESLKKLQTLMEWYLKKSTFCLSTSWWWWTPHTAFSDELQHPSINAHSVLSIIVRWRSWGSPISTLLNFSELLTMMMEIPNEDAHTGCGRRSSLRSDQIMWASSFHRTVYSRCQMRVMLQVCYKWQSDCYLLAHLERRLIHNLINEADIWNTKVVLYLCFSFEDFYWLFSQQTFCYVKDKTTDMINKHNRLNTRC